MRTIPKIRGLNVDLSIQNAEGQNPKSFVFVFIWHKESWQSVLTFQEN